jgi:dihydroneopterin aldolase
MGVIELKGLSFKAYHGYYDEEREKGNQFLIDVLLEVDFTKAARADDLNHTIDYEGVYAVISHHMVIPSRLLEHVVNNILEELKEKYPQANRIEVSLSKLNPPIGGPCHAAVVRETYTR